MLRKLDDFLIDRVHQPIADALARHVSCYGIAGFLFTGFLVVTTAGDVFSGRYVSSLINFWALFPIFRCAELDKQPVSNVMPEERVTDFFWRLVWLSLMPFAALSGAVPPFVWDRAAHGAAVLLLIPAIYFMACRKNPPKRKEAAPRGALRVFN